SVVDYHQHRTIERTQSSIPSGDHGVETEATAPDRGFHSFGYMNEKPEAQIYDAATSAAGLARNLRRYPEGMLRAASAQRNSLRFVGIGEEAGRNQNVIAFTDADGASIMLYFDAA